MPKRPTGRKPPGRAEPPTPEAIRPTYKWARWQACVEHLQSELVRLRRDVDSLAPYQNEIIRELKGGFSEDAIADMFWWWHYDIAKLAKALTEGGIKQRPRIKLVVEITSKENLSRVVPRWIGHG